VGGATATSTSTSTSGSGTGTTSQSKGSTGISSASTTGTVTEFDSSIRQKIYPFPATTDMKQNGLILLTLMVLMITLLKGIYTSCKYNFEKFMNKAFRSLVRYYSSLNHSETWQ
jgi:hypothetical protein